MAVHADVMRVDESGNVTAKRGAWAFGQEVIAISRQHIHGWIVSYELAHPKRGHFIDSPVGGMHFRYPDRHRTYRRLRRL